MKRRLLFFGNWKKRFFSELKTKKCTTLEGLWQLKWTWEWIIPIVASSEEALHTHFYAHGAIRFFFLLAWQWEEKCSALPRSQKINWVYARTSYHPRMSKVDSDEKEVFQVGCILGLWPAGVTWLSKKPLCVGSSKIGPMLWKALLSTCKTINIGS